jgi:hypothetical protein
MLDGAPPRPIRPLLALGAGLLLQMFSAAGFPFGHPTATGTRSAVTQQRRAGEVGARRQPRGLQAAEI